MRIVFTTGVLASKDLWAELDRIVQKVEDGWHLWEIPDLDAIEESAWLQQGRPLQRELFEEVANRSAWHPGGIHRQGVFVILEPEEEAPNASRAT